ncbi:dUTP diphosphatase [Mycoplasmopsis fermentans]|nr:dUTP diphosphatase [Mycoplasmopsis fermentans]ADV34410.1 Conserved Hypothetical Protein [Mycoplasmopsis fermentans M64]RMX35662.1 dUTPase family protein [Mycoplasmopsis fermentans MF-I1]RMX35674.1 dUTPase family protein [Mycoplasmopsis fermentans MF-I2]VEU64170.1 Uncharacterized protein conserved in bacteria [Mycoplasmopsis fermentans]
MNLTKIFTMQKDLDKAIAARNDIDAKTSKSKIKEFHYMKLLALLVETAEFANEVQTFKYWKAKKQIDKDKALEEFADILHFVGSFAYQYEVDPNITPLIMSKDVNKQICLLFQTISSATNNINKYVIGEILALTLGVAKLLGYSQKDLLEAYYNKNKKNYERIKNKY